MSAHTNASQPRSGPIDPGALMKFVARFGVNPITTASPAAKFILLLNTVGRDIAYEQGQDTRQGRKFMGRIDGVSRMMQ